MRLHVPANIQPQPVGRRFEQLDCFDRSGREAETALRVDGLLDVLAGRTSGSFERAVHQLSELCGGLGLVERLVRPQADLDANSVKEVEPIPLTLLSRIMTPLERRRIQRRVLVGSGIEDLPCKEGIEAGSRLAAEVDRRPYLAAVFDDEAFLSRWRADVEDLLILCIDGRIRVPDSAHAVIALTAAHAALWDMRLASGAEAPWTSRFSDEEVLIELTGIGAQAIAGGPLSAVREQFADVRLEALRAAAWLARQSGGEGFALPKSELFPEGLDGLTDAAMRGRQERYADYVREVVLLRRQTAERREQPAKRALEALSAFGRNDFGNSFSA